MSFSGGSGGTLTLPSPTHVHHVDMSSAVRSLRRSLSRSPSKFRVSGSASPTPSSAGINFRQSPTPSRSALFQHPTTSNTPIPATPAALAGPSSPTSFSAPPQQATAGTPYKPNIKLSVRSTRSKPLTRPLSRSRVSPKSPLKRVFGPAHDSGNPIPSLVPGAEARGQENKSFSEFASALSPASRRNLERPSRHSVHLDISGSSKTSFSKFLDIGNESLPPASVSPLKRSDATMSLDQPSFGSPVAKRRSLHGLSNADDTSEPTVFDHTPVAQPQQGFDIHEDANHEYQLTGSGASLFRDPLVSPTPSALTKRSSSLRKSTVSQRFGEKGSWGRRTGEKQLALFSLDTTTPVSNRNRPRLSLDQYQPLEDRGSPFSMPGTLPNPSAHPLARAANQPHPLSRSLTQSSSGSSLPDDSPTHIPVQFERPRVPLNFSKSLPPGSQRPVNDSGPVATPNYKQAKPCLAAFASTGLISKQNHFPELGPAKHPGAKVAMPDTPCKKQYNSHTYPPQQSSGGGRRNPHRMSFGSASRSGSPTSATPFRGSGVYDRSGGLLFQQRNGHSRTSSMFSLDGDDLAASNDDFPPPTPTKNIFKSFSTPAHPDVSRLFTTPAPPAFGLSNTRPTTTPEEQSYTPPGAPATEEQVEADQAVEPAIRPTTPFTGSSPFMSVSHPALGGAPTRTTLFATPAPSRTAPLFHASVNNAQYTIGEPATHASPLGMKTYTPRTPQEPMHDSMAPPDPSSLSISGRSARPPATPTTHEHSLFSSFGDRRMSITPQNGARTGDIDECLAARFDRTELIGQGEFSRVYRVVKHAAPASFVSSGVSTTPRTPPSPNPEKVFAVKKISIPALVKEREAKLREVNILRALGHSTKVVHYVEHWEAYGHLYIQTEFCSEGSLEDFLKDVGSAGRLDDFRIWKIMVETTEGLAAIHEAGFAHLDIKPANILVNFDGSLKIADFGLATSLPPPKGIEGEGDREYIAPEILLGRYDKTADIFSLGLIILEVACNVFLPENGPTWQALRSGDLSFVPSLTAGETGAITRDANGLPIEHSSPLQENNHGETFPFEPMTHNPSNLFGTPTRTDLREPPSFMVDASDPWSLDSIVKTMISPDPDARPTAQAILGSEPINWVNSRRHAGATVYEGNWGPSVGPSVEELVDADTEMTGI
ncbi:mitosis inhibitor protein kinase [Podospora australis]|uniref:Mitosis inhibitor protein kinase n=1 Tax=Podospora australis TaxID=1536484 RepID=A0AAN6X516_9PEZI|nr:mitosis inhibitor protein kinase [Podospora australis]